MQFHPDTGMRFSTNQLRLLQESLTPPMPQLAAPPEMAQPHAGQPPHAAQQQPCQASTGLSFFSSLPHPVPAAGRQQAACSSWIPCWVLLPAYVSVGFFVLAVAVLLPSQLPPSLLFAGSAPLPAALLVHALATPQSRQAQCAAAICIVAAPALCGSMVPEAVAAAAVLASVFFSLATSSHPCNAILRMLSPAVTLFVASCAGLACFSSAQPGGTQLQRSAWLLLGVALCAQAAASAVKARSFELLCSVKPV
jgi:hypothetical protein